MHKNHGLKEEGFLLVHGSEGVPVMVGRQLDWVNLWLQKLPVVALKGFLQ